MSRGVTASLVVQYTTAGDRSIIRADFDPEHHSGSNFSPGEQIYFRIFANCPFTIVTAGGSSVRSSGTGITAASGVQQIDGEVLTFIQTKTASLNFPYSSNWAFSWISTRPGHSYANPTTPVAGSGEVFITTSLAENTILGAGRASWRSNFERWRMTPSSSVDGHVAIILIQETI